MQSIYEARLRLGSVSFAHTAQSERDVPAKYRMGEGERALGRERRIGCRAS